jgi:hypothetical protein
LQFFAQERDISLYFGPTFGASKTRKRPRVIAAFFSCRVLEVIVVDDWSRDDTPEFCARRSLGRAQAAAPAERGYVRRKFRDRAYEI